MPPAPKFALKYAYWWKKVSLCLLREKICRAQLQIWLPILESLLGTCSHMASHALAFYFKAGRLASASETDEVIGAEKVVHYVDTSSTFPISHANNPSVKIKDFATSLCARKAKGTTSSGCPAAFHDEVKLQIGWLSYDCKELLIFCEQKSRNLLKC